MTGKAMSGSRVNDELHLEPSSHLRVLVALEVDVMRLGVCSLLDASSLTDHVEGHARWEQALAALEREPCDVVISSGSLPDDELTQLGRRIQDADAKLVLVLRRSAVATLSRRGARLADGFLLEEQLTPTVLNDALERIHNGELFMPEKLARELVSSVQVGGARRTDSVYLTPREKQVLILLSRGLSNRQIGTSLGISEHGSKRHVANVMAKLNSGNRTLAVAEALRLGLLDDRAERLT